MPTLKTALKRTWRIAKRVLLVILAPFVLGYLLPQIWTNPVAGMNDSSYNHESFWYYPWGKSGTHKGIDIFASQGTEVRASTYGLVVACGNNGRGGNFVLTLGPKWRFHYYAHLHTIETSKFSWVSSGERIGSVGNTGNAAGKPHHLHYTISTPIPYPWRIDGSVQGWRKMWFLNPIDYLDHDEAGDGD